MALSSCLAILVVTAIPAPAVFVFAATLSGTDGEDTLLGTDDADTIYGNADNDVILGYGGNDKLYGGRGGDIIKGDDGDDSIYGWRGGNFLFGGNGDDSIYATGTDSQGERVNYISGDDGDDSIVRMWGPSIIYGGNGNDNITSGADELVRPATVYAEAGDDEVYMYNDDSAYGGNGNDYLWGTYNSHLFGEGGDDTLVAHSPDIMSLTGGEGADHFDCQGSSDVELTDFNSEEGDTQENCQDASST